MSDFENQRNNRRTASAQTGRNRRDEDRSRISTARILNTTRGPDGTSMYLELRLVIKNQTPTNRVLTPRLENNFQDREEVGDARYCRAILVLKTEDNNPQQSDSSSTEASPDQPAPKRELKVSGRIERLEIGH